MSPRLTEVLDAKTRQFYQCFDARSGGPTLQALYDLFATDAQICQITDAGVISYTVSEFIESRAKKYNELDLSTFHEWELKSQNVAHSQQIYRYSYYRKEGQVGVCSTGIKIFQFSECGRIQWLTWIDKELKEESDV